MTEQPGMDSAPVEDRLTAFFAADAGTPETPPEGQAQEVSASDEQPQETEPQEAEEQPAEDSGLEEVELDGETYRVPPKLKEAVLRQADYTRKTQELAEVRRQVQAEARMNELNRQFQQAAQTDYQQLNEVQSQINQYRNLDWANMDTDTHLRAKHQLDTLKERAQVLQQGLSGKAQQFMQQQEFMRQEQLRQGMEYLRRAIPKFDAETASSLRSYAQNEGFTPSEVESLSDPRVVKLMWKAAQFDALQSGKTASLQAVKKAPPVIKPGASQGPNANANRRFNDARVRLKKSGSTEAFAEALLASKLVR